MTSEVYRIGIEQARGVLGDLVTSAQQGTDVILTRNRRPVARLTAYQEDTMATLTTDRDARQYVETAITAGDATCDEYDMDAIVDELRELAGGWDFDSIDFDAFWAVVAKHQRTAVASTFEATVTEDRDGGGDATGGNIGVDKCRDGAVIASLWVRDMTPEQAESREWDAILVAEGWTVVGKWEDHDGYWTATVRPTA